MTNVAVNENKKSFRTVSRIEFKNWSFEESRVLSTVNAIDRYFYLFYSQSFLEEIEKARINRKKGEKRFTFLNFNQNSSEDKFISEYLGVSQGRNSISGHRDKMTARIHQVYQSVTDEKPNKENSLDRQSINYPIMKSPFACLKVAFLLMQQLKNQKELKTENSQQIISEKLQAAYENEIWKWIWYWVVTSHLSNDLFFYDLFLICPNEHKLKEVFTKKLSDIINYASHFNNKQFKVLIIWHTVSFLYNCQEFLLKEEVESGSEDKYAQQKEILAMLNKSILEIMKNKEFKAYKLSKEEEKILFVLYPLHPSRLDKTLDFFRNNRPIHHLAWHIRLVPDEILHKILKINDEEFKKTLGKAFKTICDSQQKTTTRDQDILNRLGIKSKIKNKNGLTSPSSKEKLNLKPDVSQKKQKISNQKIPHETTPKQVKVIKKETKSALFGKTKSNTNTNHIKSDTIDLNQIIQKSFLLNMLKNESDLKVVCLNLFEVILINDLEFLKWVIDYLKLTYQADSNFSQENIMNIWKNKDNLVKEKLNPMQKIKLESFSKNIHGSYENNKGIIFSFFETKFGSYKDALENEEKKVFELLNHEIQQDGKNYSLFDLLKKEKELPEEFIQKVVQNIHIKEQFSKDKNIKQLLITCSKILSLQSE